MAIPGVSELSRSVNLGVSLSLAHFSEFSPGVEILVVGSLDPQWNHTGNTRTLFVVRRCHVDCVVIAADWTEGLVAARVFSKKTTANAKAITSPGTVCALLVLLV